MESLKKENIGWIDALRITACFLVIVSHCCDPFIAQFDADRGAFLTGVFAGSLVRPCVPLFVMMTGVLLLPVRLDAGEFYKKRIGRIVLPLVFWSVALPLMFFAYLNYVNPGTENPLISMEEHSIGATMGKLHTFVFNFNFDTVPMWYLYMLMGLYLAMPVISPWLEKAKARDIRIFLYVWGVSMVLPYIKMAAPALGFGGYFGNMGILGVCDWNEYGTFYYFSGFIGYLVLAYYLMRYPLDWSWKKTLWITLPMFAAGYLVTSLGYVLVNSYFPGNYAYLEIVWYFAGINVFMMTFPVFVIAGRLKIASRPWLSRMASLAFGIYLCHYVFVTVTYDIFDVASLPYAVRILAMSCTVFLMSCIVACVMDLSKFTRRFIR